MTFDLMAPQSCSDPGCGATPSHYLVLKVPPLGMVPDAGVIYTMAATWCEQHALAQTPATHVRAIRQELLREAANRGLIALDLGKAELDVRPLGDDHWLQFVQAMARQSGGGNA